MRRDLEKAARLVRSAKDILLVSHIDADGISSAAISSRVCERLGIEYEILFAKKMDEGTVDAINNSGRSLVWITDLGSGYLSSYHRDRIVVTDHHVPDPNFRRRQTCLDNFITLEHINPHLYGIDGTTEACGASMTYLLARTIDPKNTDLAYLAVIGACGDIQDRNESRLTGINETILKDAIDNGDVTVEKDLRLFGRETRTLVQFLQYSSDPQIDGLSDNSAGCNRLLSSLDIPLKDDGRTRCWNDLTNDEKNRIRKAVIGRVPEEDIERVFGDVYSLPRFPREGGLRDVKEFATSLNSCGRYDDAPTGLKLCFGDVSAIKDAENNRSEHRRNISAAIQYVKQHDLIRVRRFIQYFDAGNAIKETVVGIVAGMILNTEGFRRDLPMFAFADADDGVKVSGRADRSLGERGLDLSKVMRIASEAVGGYGGGHNVAAGATIPPDKKEEFLDAVEDLVCAQIN